MYHSHIELRYYKKKSPTHLLNSHPISLWVKEVFNRIKQLKKLKETHLVLRRLKEALPKSTKRLIFARCIINKNRSFNLVIKDNVPYMTKLENSKSFCSCLHAGRRKFKFQMKSLLWILEQHNSIIKYVN